VKLPLLLLAVLVLFSPAETLNQQLKTRAFRQTNEHKIIAEFIQLLSIPNVASDQPNIRRNADLIMEMMRRRKLNPRLLEAKTPNVPPAVYGEWLSPGAEQTIIFYAHYDGQPTDSSQWKQQSLGTPISNKFD
jgi:acetylornithine deacetylase/succinyl-diaminopimelate desuccinylase-like protein